MRARARSWVAAGSRRALGRPRRRDTSPAAPSWTNARSRRRTWRSPIWSSPAARRRVSRRSAIRVRTCRRSSSFMLNVRGPAIPALCRKSGHLYFGGTGHLHFGPTGQGLIAWVASTLAPNEGYALGSTPRIRQSLLARAGAVGPDLHGLPRPLHRQVQPGALLLG